MELFRILVLEKITLLPSAIFIDPPFPEELEYERWLSFITQLSKRAVPLLIKITGASSVDPAVPFSAMIQSLNVTQDGVITFCPELWFQLDWPSIFTAFPLPPTSPPFVMVNPIICNVVSVPSRISKMR